MLKSTILSIAAFMFLFVIWAATPVRADCPHKDNFNHKHCDNVVPESAPVSAVVRDSQGAYVGAFMDTPTGDIIWVLRQGEDTAVRIEVTFEGLTQTEFTLKYENTTNCTGEPLLGGAPNLYAQGLTRGTTVYYAPAAFLDPVTIQSSSRSPIIPGACTGGDTFIEPNICCTVPTNPFPDDNLGPARMIDLSHLVAPFHAEVQE